VSWGRNQPACINAAISLPLCFGIQFAEEKREYGVVDINVKPNRSLRIEKNDQNSRGTNARFNGDFSNNDRRKFGEYQQMAQQADSISWFTGIALAAWLR
jgi:hypothetical protein